MTKAEFLEVYGQSVYSARLQIAIAIYAKLDRQPQEAIQTADELISALMAEDMRWLISVHR